MRNGISLLTLNSKYFILKMISYEEFVQSCQYFTEVGRKVGDTWDVVDNAEKYKFYLVKRKFTFLPVSTKNKEIEDSLAVLEDMEEEPVEDTLCLNVSTAETLIAELHIVFSVAHSVPVLYFNIWDQTGKLVCLDKIWELLSNSPEILQDKLGSLSQSDHPIEGVPFFYFHPCNTLNVMKFITPNNAVNSEETRDIKFYIPNWFSIYGSSLGFSVSLEYFK